MRSLLLVALVVAGCGFLGAGAHPVVEAHRGGAMEFPQNSRAAVVNAVEKRYPGLEFDLVLTSDLVPVVSHDPWIHQTLCTRADGTALPQAKEERVFIRDVTAEALRTGFLCGGVPDGKAPGAVVVAEPMMTLDELLALLPGAPAMLVHLDVKYEPGMTHEPDVMAREIVSRWRAAALPNPWYVSATLPESVRAFEALSAGGPIETSLVWPRFPPDSEDRQTQIALTNELASTLGFSHIVDYARAAGADGLAIPYQVVDRGAVQAAKDAGLKVQVWTLNSVPLLETFCDWPVDSVITDMPAEAPCL